MQEHQVTASGATHRMPDPFHVFATQNPIEQEGTYPLPEAQLDRFMFMLDVRYPAADEEVEIVRATTGEAKASVAEGAEPRAHPGAAGPGAPGPGPRERGEARGEPGARHPPRLGGRPHRAAPPPSGSRSS
jgi:hypothetical protein